ncbi:MAG: bifunctional demethylmenaquinone methyltransferase/2-methoxy-6-polyprenyl-1,4-benzoquinol methylase UbiE [Candidatus Bipolaricaulia bacterium]
METDRGTDVAARNPETIRRMFSVISPWYDFLNHLLSFNLDRRWRRVLIEAAEPKPGERILDVCTGTGDVAIAFTRRIEGGGQIIGLDFSGRMLHIGREKLVRGQLNRVSLLQGDALDLPFADGQFGIVTIAFGLRNLKDYRQGISEMSRVLAPEGQLLILEFSLPRGRFGHLYHFYLQRLLPQIGGLFSRRLSAYRYLANSIQDFPEREDILALMAEQGLENLKTRDLTRGIVTVYCGEKR